MRRRDSKGHNQAEHTPANSVSSSHNPSRSSQSVNTMATRPIINIAGIWCSQPVCLRCDGPTRDYIVNSSNRNYNAGRPYYTCSSPACGKFSTFADDRGVQPQNQPCECGHPSRRQLAGLDRTVPRGLHFVCTIGHCNFRKPDEDQNGRQITCTDPGQARAMVRIKHF